MSYGLGAITKVRVSVCVCLTHILKRKDVDCEMVFDTSLKVPFGDDAVAAFIRFEEHINLDALATSFSIKVLRRIPHSIGPKTQTYIAMTIIIIACARARYARSATMVNGPCGNNVRISV